MPSFRNPQDDLWSANKRLLGSNTVTNDNMSSIFGSTSNQQPSGTGLFGSSTQNQPAQGTGLFGNNTATSTGQAGTSLFGGSTANQTQSTGLFGAPASSNTGGTSLFGANPSNTNNNSSSLFNTQPTQNTAGTSTLFGNANASQQPPQRTWAERTFDGNPQQAQLASLLQSGLGGNPGPQQLELAKQRLAQLGVYSHANEKSIIQQVQTLIRKWDPHSQDTLMQTYLYNAVNAAYAPFYYPNEGERDEEWEEALKRKPEAVKQDGGDGVTVSFVPVLVRGFKALGERVEYQARAVNDFRIRLHEMNNSLSAVMDKHQQSLSVRIEEARRRHINDAQRVLRLAVKAQTLRMRGYPLSEEEEKLRKQLLELERGVCDPAFGGREEAVWARMVALRERGRWLEQEGERLASASGGVPSGGSRSGGGLDEAVVQKTKRILRDYDGQLTHLGKELEEVSRELEEWEVEKKTR